jgi:hypothetical protein
MSVAVLDRIDLAQLHATIATSVVDKLVATQWLTRAQHGRAYHRCRALLAINPNWTISELFGHCVDACNERMLAKYRAEAERAKANPWSGENLVASMKAAGYSI